MDDESHDAGNLINQSYFNKDNKQRKKFDPDMNPYHIIMSNPCKDQQMKANEMFKLYN